MTEKIGRGENRKKTCFITRRVAIPPLYLTLFIAVPGHFRTGNLRAFVLEIRFFARGANVMQKFRYDKSNGGTSTRTRVKFIVQKKK